jgi:hypothetical protein
MRMFRTTFASLAVLLAVSVGSWAQTTTAPNPAADVKVSNDKDGTQTPKDFFGQTIAGHWAFSSEFGFSQEYDDNVFSSPFLRLSDNVSRINARFSAAVQKKRLRMQVHYYPDYVTYSKYSDRNALSNQYAHEISYRWSAHTDMSWTLTASRAPGYSNSPFTLVSFDGLFLPVFRPDALQSNATITNATTGFDWSHQFTARQSLKVDVQGSAIEFKEDNGVPLSTLAARKSFSGGATVRWEDEFVPRHRFGVEFGEQYFGFLEPGSHSNYQFIKARYSQSFGHGYQFSAGAGPSRHERQTVGTFGGSDPIGIDYALDVSLAKTALRQSIGLSYNHGSQLGLTQGSLGSDSVSVTYLRQIGRKWHANAGFSYSRTQNETTTLISTANSYSANGGLEYELWPQLSFNAGYSYVSQDLAQGLLFGNSSFDRNVFRVGLRYKLQHNTSR